MSNGNCKNCRYFDKQIDKNDVTKSQGNCHRYPPASHPVPTHQGVAMMTSPPVVSGDSWCGEFAPVDINVRM